MFIDSSMKICRDFVAMLAGSCQDKHILELQFKEAVAALSQFVDVLGNVAFRRVDDAVRD